MFKLEGEWKKIIERAFKEAKIITEATKGKDFCVMVGVRDNGINYCEIKQTIK